MEREKRIGKEARDVPLMRNVEVILVGTGVHDENIFLQIHQGDGTVVDDAFLRHLRVGDARTGLRGAKYDKQHKKQRDEASYAGQVAVCGKCGQGESCIAFFPSTCVAEGYKESSVASLK